MKIYGRNYLKNPNKDEWEAYNAVLEKEKIEGIKLGRLNLRSEYPEAIRHYNSLFPNNHIELMDVKNGGKMPETTNAFYELVHEPNTKERDILHFINHESAHYLMMSLLKYHHFGHQDAYIMPEFQIENGRYRADYLIIGKSSGGYEFLFVELEAPHGNTVIQSGHLGVATRSGLDQIKDWQEAIEGSFSLITEELNKYTNKALPPEFSRYDSTRFHYTVVTGLRDDYLEPTYRERRDRAIKENIDMWHYDNVCDFAKDLEYANSF